MTRYQLIAILLGITTAFGAKSADFPYQSLTYDISYHCGFISKEAAQAIVQISCYDGTFNAILDGRSIPIMDVIYCINDTLQSRFVPSGESAQPAAEHIDYISGYYRKPHTDDRTPLDSPKAYRTIGGAGELSASPSTIECVTLTADMLCLLYYAKTVEFDRMQPGVAVDVPIMMPYGGERTLQLLYNGVTDYNGRQAYSLVANFTYGDGLSQYPINVMIDKELRIPTDFSAEIEIGHVNMTYRF